MKQHIIEPLLDIEYVYLNNTKLSQAILNNHIRLDGTWNDLNVFDDVSIQVALRHMNCVENFLGLGIVIFNSSVPQGKIYGTAKENIVMYYIPVNGADLEKAFSFTTDETGYIGIHESSDYTNLTSSDIVINGMKLFAERIDGIIVGTINKAA